MSAWYNENDPHAAAWLRELIAEGHIAPGVVDERSIEDVRPDELLGFTQCHFFAGIGGWSLGLRLAGWPDDRPVWTGSCPCQPFSAAGRHAGTDDPRHLWPAFRWPIDQRRPATVFGEQVASKDGRGWLAGVRADLEAMGYAVGAADLCAAGVGAPQIRQRLLWVADSDGGKSGQAGAVQPGGEHGQQPQDRGIGWLGDTGSQGFQERARDGGVQHVAGRALKGQAPELPGDPWGRATWLPCADGKARRIEPGLEPLVDGLPGRVGLLRGYGNAIVPEVAAAFIAAADGQWPEWLS